MEGKSGRGLETKLTWGVSLYQPDVSEWDEGEAVWSIVGEVTR